MITFKSCGKQSSAHSYTHKQSHYHSMSVVSQLRECVSRAYGASRYHPCLIIQVINQGRVVLISSLLHTQDLRVCVCLCMFVYARLRGSMTEGNEMRPVSATWRLHLAACINKNIMSSVGTRQDCAGTSASPSFPDKDSPISLFCKIWFVLVTFFYFLE